MKNINLNISMTGEANTPEELLRLLLGAFEDGKTELEGFKRSVDSAPYCRACRGETLVRITSFDYNQGFKVTVPADQIVDLYGSNWIDQIPFTKNETPNIPRDEALSIVMQMFEDTEAGELKWFSMTPGIGMGYGIANCEKRDVYEGSEFWIYTDTIYNTRSGEERFTLRYKDTYGWIDVDIGKKLLKVVKESITKANAAYQKEYLEKTKKRA